MTESAKSFKEQFTFDERLEESAKKRAQFPNLLPVILSFDKKCKLPSLERDRHLVSGDLKLGELIKAIRTKLRLSKSQSLLFFIDNKKLMTMDTLLKDIYAKYKDPDGFLYITMTDIEPFGF